MPGTYLNHYSDFVQTQTRFNEQAVLIGGVRDNVAIANSGISSISQQMPSLARGTDLANANVKLDTQAVLIGGIQSRANSIYTDTQQIRNNDIPRLATGNQANAISSSIATVRSEQSSRFNAVDSQLTSVSAQLTSINAGGSGGGSSSVVSLDSSEFLSPLIVNFPWLDLGYLLGSIDTGFGVPSGVVINIVGNTTEGGNANNLTAKNGTSWYSTNASGRTLTIDFGFNKTTRTIKLTGLGFYSFDISGGSVPSLPVNLIIAGSNNNSSYTTINTWSSIGFNATNQWKYTTFSNSTAYRYIRISQSGVNVGGSNYFACRGLRFYGSIQNP